MDYRSMAFHLPGRITLSGGVWMFDSVPNSDGTDNRLHYDRKLVQHRPPAFSSVRGGDTRCPRTVPIGK